MESASSVDSGRAVKGASRTAGRRDSGSNSSNEGNFATTIGRPVGKAEFEHLFVILRCRGVAKADAVG